MKCNATEIRNGIKLTCVEPAGHEYPHHAVTGERWAVITHHVAEAHEAAKSEICPKCLGVAFIMGLRAALTALEDAVWT